MASDTSGEQKQSKVIVGVKGVRLKHFEQVVAQILPHIQPLYVQLPRPPSTHEDDWPFDQLPAAARVYGTLKGQLSNPQRATRKEDQIRSMLRCIFHLLSSSTDTSTTIVDFGGGSGHLSIPLALLLPSCRIIVVDLSQHSLDLLHLKASRCGSSSSSTPNLDATNSDGLKACPSIPNLFTFHGPIEQFQHSFDIGVALHLCGEATDVALRKCGLQPSPKRRALVFAPCCVGKLNPDKKNPYVFQATGTNTATIQYPQSQLFSCLVTNQNDWNALAKAADYSDLGECRTCRNATRRTAKALLETDRQLYLQEIFGFTTCLTRMDPWEASPKNDIIMAWCVDNSPSQSLPVDLDCQTDVRLTIDHLLTPPDSAKQQLDHNGVDWTREEEESVRATLENFLASDETVLVFPTRLGGRKRKLIHYMAEQMKLAHWCEGQKWGDRTVAVARRGRKRKEVVEG